MPLSQTFHSVGLDFASIFTEGNFSNRDKFEKVNNSSEKNENLRKSLSVFPQVNERDGVCFKTLLVYFYNFLKTNF